MGHQAVQCPSRSGGAEAVSESIRSTRDITPIKAMAVPSALSWTRSVRQDHALPILPMTQEVMAQFPQAAASPTPRRSATWAGPGPLVDVTAAYPLYSAATFRPRPLDA